VLDRTPRTPLLGVARDEAGDGVVPDAYMDEFGRDKREVAGWILDTTGAFILQKPLPGLPGVVGTPKRGGGGVGTGFVGRVFGGVSLAGSGRSV